jgi:two-component system, OmpR family, sensor kinase
VTLTTRLVARALLVMALALGGVSLLTYEFVRVSGRLDVDNVLRGETQQLGATLASEVTRAAGLDGILTPPEMERAARAALVVHPSGPRHVAAITVDGVRLQASGGPPRAAALLRGLDAPTPEPGRLRSTDTAVGPVRVLDTAVTDPSGTTLAIITVLAPLDPSRDAATGALVRTALASVIALVVGGAALALVMRRSLRPLRDLSTAAREITHDDLTARVPIPESGDEVEALARELNDMLDRIDEGDRTRLRYLAAISHEVRTPLTVAEGHLELLERQQVDPATAAATVRHELDRLSRILGDLLSVARRDDEIDIRPGPVFVPDLFAAISARINALGYTDRVRFDEPPPAAFTGDQARIEQSVLNLVQNSIDHNPPETSVTVAARAAEGSVAIEVTDDGTGIDPELLPKVLEPFVTSRPTGRRRASGLGLTVVDALTRAQHGRLDLVSSPAGTTATLTYPVDPVGSS